jgi:histidinol-phosphate aminotransferase
MQMNERVDPGRLVRDELRNLTPYEAEDYPNVIKLDANENPFDFPEEILRALVAKFESRLFTRYPDAMARNLVQELADLHGIAADQILTGNGSDELILNIMLAFGTRNRVVIAVPTFSMYGIHARVAGAKVVEVPRCQDFNLPVENIIRTGSNAALVILCSPNNPTGNSATTGQLEAILENCPCPVVVDQAYVEFGGTDFLPLLERHPNLVILRTFSKAFGLAGLRVGYLFAAPGIMQYLLKVKQPFNVNAFSQLAAAEVLRHQNIFKQQIAEIITEREYLYAALRKMPGVTVYSSDANYLLFKTEYPAGDIYNGLLERQVLVRKFNDPLIEGCLRVSVGRPRENKIFLQSLQQVIGVLEEKK